MNLTPASVRRQYLSSDAVRKLLFLVQEGGGVLPYSTVVDVFDRDDERVLDSLYAAGCIDIDCAIETGCTVTIVHAGAIELVRRGYLLRCAEGCE